MRLMTCEGRNCLASWTLGAWSLLGAGARVVPWLQGDCGAVCGSSRQAASSRPLGLVLNYRLSPVWNSATRARPQAGTRPAVPGAGAAVEPAWEAGPGATGLLWETGCGPNYPGPSPPTPPSSLHPHLVSVPTLTRRRSKAGLKTSLLRFLPAPHHHTKEKKRVRKKTSLSTVLRVSAALFLGGFTFLLPLLLVCSFTRGVLAEGFS